MKKALSIALSLLLTACMIFTMAACGENKTPAETTPQGNTSGGDTLEGTYDIVVWVSESAGVKELTEQQIKDFMEENPGIIINATVEGVTEAESATQMITSVEDGADLYCFAQDQLARLVTAGALTELGTKAAEEVTANNDAGAVGAASVGGKLWCYPMTSDNGYFMFYDTSIVAPEHLGSLEDIIADCEAAGAMFAMELETSAWYNAAFLFATGCHSLWTTAADGSYTSVDDDFNSDAGVIALKGMQKLLTSTCYKSSSDTAEFGAAIPAAVVVSGTWGSSTAQQVLGDNFGAAELPSFTVDGTSYHLGSFSGNKLMGVKPQTDAVKTAVLQKLALYLTSEKCQLERFETVGWGPSNLAAQQNDAVKSDTSLAALAAQSPYATPQGQIHGSWWDIAKVYASSAKEATSDEDLKAALQQYEDTINGLFSMSEEEKNAFTIIGTVNGTNWDTDFKMVKQDDGSWLTEEAYTMDAGVEFKARQGGSWDVNYGNGGDNFVVDAAGTYYIRLTIEGENGTITLEPAE